MSIFNAIQKGCVEVVQRFIATHPEIVKSKTHHGWTVFDCAIAWGTLEIAQYIWKNGGRPSLVDDLYRDGEYSPLHEAVRFGEPATLKWVLETNIFPFRVFQFKDNIMFGLLDHAVISKRWETATILQNLFQVYSVFLAMQRAKRDHQCVLCRLPNELLDMVVDEVAARFFFFSDFL